MLSPMNETEKRTQVKGSCHCGAVTFEASLDLSKGTGVCNCRMCRKSGVWSAITEPNSFTLLTGEDQLTDYQHAAKLSHFLFCKTCGQRAFGHGDMPWLGGKFVSVNLNCVDTPLPAGLEVRHFNGRDNDWQAPKVTRTAEALP